MSTGRLRWVLDFLRIEAPEVPLVLLMTLYFFLAMACASVVRALQNALYLGNVGFDWRLPALYLLLAGVSIGVVVAYRGLARRFSRIWVSILTLILFILCLLLFTAPIASDQEWIYPVFYVWGGVFSLLVPTQGWLLSYEFYTTRQAKRLFAILGTGGIFGGAFGGFYAASLSSRISILGLLIHVVIGLCLMQLVLIAIQRLRARSVRAQDDIRTEPGGQDPEKDAEQTSFSELLRSRYVLTLATLVLVVGATTTIIDLQFKGLLEERYSGSPEDITRLFGMILGLMFSLSAAIQLLATSRVIRRFGVTFTLIFLPLTLLAGVIPAVMAAGFWFRILPKMIDGTLRSSLHRVGVELLYIPIQGRQTITAKGFIDLVVTRLGDATGAFVLLGAFFFLGFAVESMSWLILVGAIAWLLLTLRLGREYVQHLRTSLAGELVPELSGSWRQDLSGGGHMVLEALDSPAPSKIIFALKLLSTSEDYSMNLMNQSGRIPDISGVYRAVPWLDKAVPLVDHPNLHVAAAALHLLASHYPETYLEKIKKSCSAEQIPDRLCLFYLDQYEPDPSGYLQPEKVVLWAEKANQEQARVLSRLMAKTKEPQYLNILRKWMESSSQPLASAAITAVGRFGREEDIRPLIGFLAQGWSRGPARVGLASFGDVIVEDLLTVIQRPETVSAVRASVPLILGEIGTQEAQRALFQCLYLQDSVVAFRALKSLNKIRGRGKLMFEADFFLPILQIWAREHYELINLELLLGGDRERGTRRLLQKTVAERVEWGIERIFRGLALFLPGADAHSSYLAYVGDQTALRENAIELIDSLVKGELRQTIMPILNEESPEKKAEIGRSMFRLSGNLEQVLSDALFQADPWLKCCLLAWIKGEGKLGLRPRVVDACEDRNAVVRETAQWALSTWGNQWQPVMEGPPTVD